MGKTSRRMISQNLSFSEIRRQRDGDDDDGDDSTV
jgi:hypothetical protein